ncbi:MAG: acetyl-CoA carboxylase biotin carboxylase subunit [Bacteroidales bacterium]|jgi:acetyl-CoA carboxylase biotin carboxylase subunit|nr:acetyl-CoA carboxylase biotin carboxylase subunit [Bacteroidales bacterium]
MKVIHKILIANRGEIAVRVIRTARKMEIKTVAIYSQIDADSLHVTEADEAWCIGEAELSDTYLNIPGIIDIARKSGCDAIHPGYGFLAENPLFVDACTEAGICFIGPDSRAMRIMGNKIAAREFVKQTHIPITEGVTGTKEELVKNAHLIGFPVLLKAAAGGGGKGMRVVYDERELAEAIESTARQAKAYFGDATVYIEKFIEEPRHIEIQILGDNYGNVVHLFERECSIQRRYQKIIEESPSATLTAEVRKKMGEAAVAIGKAIGYNNAGTIEFLVDRNLNFYFLEMNTRIQVEHPVTEMVTGIDIVEEQIHIAAGNKLRLKQEKIVQHGHAIECRIYAEDPANNFQPSPGNMTFYREPGIPGIRIDTGISAKTGMNSSFDPMISKLVVWGKDRNQARQLMLESLREYIIHGIKTNISYLSELLQSAAFMSNAITTRFCDTHSEALITSIEIARKQVPFYLPIIGYLLFSVSRNNAKDKHTGRNPDIWKQIGYWRDLMNIRLQFEEESFSVHIPGYNDNHYSFIISGKRYEVTLLPGSGHQIGFILDKHNYTAWISCDKDNQAFVSILGHLFQLKRFDFLSESVPAAMDHIGTISNHVTSPMPGKVIKINVTNGESVKKGQTLLIIEAMKMENRIVSPRDAVVRIINVMENDRVESSTALVEFEDLKI